MAKKRSHARRMSAARKGRRPATRRKKVKTPSRSARTGKRTAKKRPREARKPSTSRRKSPAAAPERVVATPPLERPRRQLPDSERLGTRTQAEERVFSAARSGRGELKAMIARHTETSPTLTAGDLDAKWEEAYAVGDEAPGGDNPTPDQDRVDDIGKALGIQYQDDQELMGGDEVTERDKHRWELDPASSDDWPHEK